MKRSEINKLMREAIDFYRQQKFALPPWATYTPKQWSLIMSNPETAKAHAELVENALGWDLTDFGSGNYYNIGLLLFTVRNGKPGAPGAKTYCEKAMIVRERQVTPYHFHWAKTEDIINRGGGNLQIRLYNSSKRTAPGSPPPPLDEKTEVVASMDGVVSVLKPGSVTTLHPGRSITLPPYLYHEFWGEPGKGTVLVGEVSTVNDDATDNCFLKAPGRFPAIDEDTKPLYLLCTEYRKAAQFV